MLSKHKKLLCITTDPFDKIQGYSLEFQRIVLILSKEFNTSLIVNYGGRSYKELNGFNKQYGLIPCTFIELCSHRYLFKGIEFVLKAIRYNKKFEIVLSNSELPELFASIILALLRRKPKIAVVYDDYTRSSDITTRLINTIRKMLLSQFEIIVFANKHTMRKIAKVGYLKSKCHFIGIPVCDAHGKKF